MTIARHMPALDPVRGVTTHQSVSLNLPSLRSPADPRLRVTLESFAQVPYRKGDDLAALLERGDVLDVLTEAFQAFCLAAGFEAIPPPLSVNGS